MLTPAAAAAIFDARYPRKVHACSTSGVAIMPGTGKLNRASTKVGGVGAGWGVGVGGGRWGGRG